MGDDAGADQFRRIQAKEAELREREHKLRQAHVHLDEEEVKNWPPCRPFIHHDIDADIPLQGVWTVRLALWGQYGFYFLLLWNVLAACGTDLEAEDTVYNVAQNVVFAILIALLGIPCGFKVNYMRLYRQARKNDISLLFFGVQALLVAAVGLGLVGLPNWGCMGIMTAIDVLRDGSGFGKFTVGICAALWAIVAAWEVMVFGKILLLFKTTGQPPAPAAI
jgi:hypothetical protein